MELTAERAGPYVRALGAALDALAPNEDHVPLSEALDHLAALDPAMSGAVLLPAEVSRHTGMPTYAWLERAQAEAVVARRGESAIRDDELRRAEALDPELAARLAARRQVHAHLRRAELLPATRLTGAVRRRTADGTQLGLAYDRISPDHRWVRVRVEVEVPEGATPALSIDLDGQLTLEEELQHLFTRHFATAAIALFTSVQDALGGRILRLARGWLGPFWFPGVQLPEGANPELGQGLLLHATTEILARDVRRSLHLDPLEPAPRERVPAGFGVYRERRLAAAGRALPAAQRLVGPRGPGSSVVPVSPR